jgi:hypothetical protein
VVGVGVVVMGLQNSKGRQSCAVPYFNELAKTFAVTAITAVCFGLAPKHCRPKCVFIYFSANFFSGLELNRSNRSNRISM